MAPKEDLSCWLTKYKPQLAVYAAQLWRDGWDTLRSLRFMTTNNMADLNIFLGHRCLVVDTLKDLWYGAWPGGALT